MRESGQCHNYEHLYYATQAGSQTERQTQYNTDKNKSVPTALEYELYTEQHYYFRRSF